MQDVNLYKSITNIDPGTKGQGHRGAGGGWVGGRGLERDQKSGKKIIVVETVRTVKNVFNH
jgi:hypothetical protein